jgi:hypothetical protein
VVDEAAPDGGDGQRGIGLGEHGQAAVVERPEQPVRSGRRSGIENDDDGLATHGANGAVVARNSPVLAERDKKGFDQVVERAIVKWFGGLFRHRDLRTVLWKIRYGCSRFNF